MQTDILLEYIHNVLSIEIKNYTRRKIHDIGKFTDHWH